MVVSQTHGTRLETIVLKNRHFRKFSGTLLEGKKQQNYDVVQVFSLLWKIPEFILVSCAFFLLENCSA